MTKTNPPIGRRSFLGGAAAVTATAVTGFPHIARAQAKAMGADRKLSSRSCQNTGAERG